MPTDDAVTLWLGRLQAGESAAARPLWEKYFHRLVGLARKRLKDLPRRASVEEVAEAVGCAPRSVKRKLQLIRTIWEREGGHEAE